MEAPPPATSSTVCVTGAGGFLASWLVKLLLSKDHYVINGTVRDLGEGKNAHLKALENAGERLRLFKADVLDYGSVAAAIAGCDGVFHVASPVTSGRPTNPEVDIIATAVTGTLNVLRASREAKVKRVVVVSSVVAVFNNPNWPTGEPFNEDSWSDEETCRKNEEWYPYYLSKTLAEREAFEYAAKTGMDIVTICPALIMGPLAYMDEEQNTRFSSEKLEKLGWTFRPMEETLRDSFESYIGSWDREARRERERERDSMEAPPPATSSTVCVTGAGGFLASWLVKLLLSKDHYVINGTVRDLGEGKNAHLKALENAGERLRLFKADVLDYGSVAAAIAGCDGVFHVASPVTSGRPTNPEVDIIATAVTGTLNVLRASREAKVKRVVVVSSVVAVFNNPNWPTGEPFNEDSWSDEETCRKNEEWYPYYLSKTLAEREAFEYAAKTGMDIVTICPALIMGPLAYRGSERYICSSTPRKLSDIINTSKSLYPTFNYPQKFVEVDEEQNTRFSSEKLEKLGWTFRPMEETLRDSFESYIGLGILT
uniref:NAD-dependent epimerase/dehydratase domain-containing protein n=1 Tax=Oryza barthii TaxID=65489 RepID=A0A0D3GX09_9ORYZ